MHELAISAEPRPTRHRPNYRAAPASRASQAGLAADPSPGRIPTCRPRAECDNLDCKSVEKLQAAVLQLLTEELNRLSEWFEGFLADRWAWQIETDILAGQLDAAGRRADENFKACLCTPLAS